jgi:phage gpG-like protein
MMEVKIEGLDRLVQKCDGKIIHGPLKRFWQRCAIKVQGRAREKAPVDRGLLRSSIATQIDDGNPPLWAKVGTNVFYAPYQEFGTGLLAEGEGKKGGRHWPPGQALDLWASRHGFKSGRQVARIIGMRGGLRPKRYLRDALKESVEDIRGFLRTLGEEIGKAWDSK